MSQYTDEELLIFHHAYTQLLTNSMHERKSSIEMSFDRIKVEDFMFISINLDN